MGRRAKDLLAIAAVVGAIVWIGDTRVRPTEAPKPVAGGPVGPIGPAPPPTLAELPIAAWIIDGSGVPIEGVAVTLRDPVGAVSSVIATSEADGSVRTDRLATAGGTLLLDAPHIFPAELAWRPGVPPPRIMLARRVQIEVHVTSGATPATGADVEITDGSGPTLAAATTDDHGVARFADLVAGPYEIWARRGTSVSPLARVDAADPRVELTLALEPGGTVRGHVSAAAATVQLVPIDVEHVARVATVDDRGQFAILGVPFGRWRVEVDAPEHVRSTDQVVELAADRPEAELEVRLVPAGVVSGIVVDTNGTPVPNATIVLRVKDGPHTDPMPVEPAPTRLRWVHPLAGERQLPNREGRRFGAPRPGVRPAECGRGHCGNDLGGKRGVVVHAAAEGEVIGAFTEIRKEAGRYVAIMHAGGLVSFYMHLDDLRPDLAVGRFVRAGEPIGTVGSTGFGKLNPHLHFAIAQERAGRRLFIDPEPILRHAVVLPVARSLVPSEPVVVASIRGASAAVLPPPRLAADAYGRFRISGVTPGTYVAAAFDAELAPGVSPAFRVTSAAETTDVRITLAQGVIVHGLVYGRDGPVPGARVVAEEGTGETTRQVATAYTDFGGAFTLRSLSGTVTLLVGAAGYGEVERTVALDADRGRRREDFELTLEDARLLGQVLAPDGTPTAAVVAIVAGPTRYRRVDTDATGQFVIDRVARGNYVVELSSDDHPSARAILKTDAWQEIRFAQGGSVRVELSDAHTDAPLAGIAIEATGPDRTARPVTDAAGVALLRALAPGAWTLRVRVPGYVAADRVVQVRRVAAPDVVRIELSRGASLAGIVRDRYGQRAAGARVSSGGVSTRADRDGGFRLVDVPTGAVRIEAELDKSHGATSVQLAPGDELVTLVIDLAE